MLLAGSKVGGRLPPNACGSLQRGLTSTMQAKSVGSLTDHAYSVVKERIIECAWMPGMILVESQLARELDVSKTPIREALQRLVQDRLLEPISRVGYRVAPITIEDVGHQFHMRRILEGEAAQLAAARVDEAALASLGALNSPWIQGDHSSYSTFLRRNQRFHTMIAELSGNPRIAAWLGSLLDEQTRVLHLGIVLEPEPDRIVNEHAELLSALANRDGYLSRLLAETQVIRSRDMVLQALRHFELDQIGRT